MSEKVLVEHMPVDCSSQSSSDDNEEESSTACARQSRCLLISSVAGLALCGTVILAYAARRDAKYEKQEQTFDGVWYSRVDRETADDWYSVDGGAGEISSLNYLDDAAHTTQNLEEGCHDMLETDHGVCMKEINWARQQGIFEHPEWYPGLDASSNLKDWQHLVFKTSRGKCPKPCSIEPSPFCAESTPPKLWKPSVPSAKVTVKVLSYNLFWWNLFGLNKGRHGSAGKLIASTMEPAYDVMGFQECENFTMLMEPVGLLADYEVFGGTHAICMGYRKAAWSLLERGEGDVSEDQPTEYYGSRGTQWMRLQHKMTRETLLFVNHHGPLSVNSGGQCGGVSTAHNLLNLIANKGKRGDIIVLVGDFNANAASLTIQELWKHLVLIFNGDSFGGVDNIFTNTGKSSVSSALSLGSGGSDHKAISATVEIGPGSIATTKVSFRGASPRVEPAKAVHDSIHSQCGLLESDHEYIFDSHTRSKNVDGITDPRVCCSLCGKDLSCKAWVLTEWVASISGPRCSLKYGVPRNKVRRAGLTSGFAAAAAAKLAAHAASEAIEEM